MQTHAIEVQGMSCSHCVKSVRDALLHVTGVTRADVEVGRAKVETADEVPRAALIAAITTAGYSAS